MRCDEFLGLYSEYLDDALPAADAAKLRAHIEECLRCKRYDQVMRRGLELARAIPIVEPSDDFHARLQHRLLHVRDDMSADGSPVGSGAAVSLALAGLLAIAAWGPAFGGGNNLDPVQEALLVESAAELVPMLDGPVPSDDAGWWMPASMATPPRTLSNAFPGPYSPLVVTPPTADYHSGIARRVLATYSGLD